MEEMGVVVLDGKADVVVKGNVVLACGSRHCR